MNRVNGAKYTDQELFDMIKEAREGREKALKYIYMNWRQSALKIARSKGYKPEDCENAIHDAIILLDKKIRKGECEYQSEGGLKNYFISMCRWRAYSQWRSTKKIDLTDEDYRLDSTEETQAESPMLELEKASIIEKILERLGEECKKVLKLYMLDYSYDEIASELGLGNSNNARQHAFQCRKNMKKMILKNPVLAEYFSKYISAR